MATEKSLRLVEASQKRIQFLASTVDAYMQDFLAMALAKDKLGSIVASARLAQLGAILCEEYEANCNVLVESETDQKVANQAAAYVLKTVNANATECRQMIGDDPVPDTVPGPDRSLS